MTGDSKYESHDRPSRPGTYPIEAGMFDRGGGGYLQVVGGQEARLQSPSLPRTELARSPPRGAPLELTLQQARAAAPATSNSSVSRSGNDLTIEWTAAGPSSSRRHSEARLPGPPSPGRTAQRPSPSALAAVSIESANRLNSFLDDREGRAAGLPGLLVVESGPFAGRCANSREIEKKGPGAGALPARRCLLAGSMGDHQPDMTIFAGS